MSYSFSVTAATKADAKQKIAQEFDNVVAGQPSHAADREAAVAAAQAFVDVLADPTEGREVYVTMTGSLGWQHDAPEKFYTAQVSINATVRETSK